VELAAAVAAAAVTLIAVYPRLFASPLRALRRTTESSSSFLDGLKSDRLYVPRHVAEEMPTLLLIFALTGAVVGATMLWQQWRISPVPATRISVVGAQALAMPTMAIVLGSDLYHGLRQLLFAAPAVAVLTAYGIAWWLVRPGSGSEPRRWVAPLAAAALLLPVVDQLTLQPYQTTYVNLATDLVTETFTNADNRPGGDFWRVSLPELIAGQPLDRLLLCKATVDKESNLSFPFTNAGEAFSTSRSLDCRQEPNGPLFPEGLPLRGKSSETEYDSVFLETLPRNCAPRNEVTRIRHGFEVVLTVLARCSISPPVLTERGVRADDPAIGTTAPHDLWRFAIDGWEQWPGRAELTSPVQRAVIAFEPSGVCREAGCVLVIEGSGPSDLVARVAGEEIPVSIGTDGTIKIPIRAPQVSTAAQVRITFNRRSGNTLGMRVTALSMTELPRPERARPERALIQRSSSGSTKGRL